MRKNRVHLLKTRQPFYTNCYTGVKRAEIRFNDRDFQADDILVLICVDDNGFVVTDNIGYEYFTFEVTNIVTADEFPDGLQPGYVMMSIQQIDDINDEPEYLAAYCIDENSCIKVLDKLEEYGLN